MLGSRYAIVTIVIKLEPQTRPEEPKLALGAQTQTRTMFHSVISLALMAVFALILPYNCYRRGVQVGDGRRKGIPKTGWFLERLEQHGLSHVMSTKHEAGTGRTLQNERPSPYLVKLVPDAEFRGALTPWDQECRFLWEYLNYPADGYSLRIASCVQFCVPVSVGFDRARLSKVVSTPGAPVDLDSASGFFLCRTDSKE